MYLSYIVQSFEYFSSKYFSLSNKDFPPLLCCIPTKQELKTHDKIDTLKCIVIMEEVSQEAIYCIKQMEPKRVDSVILYKKRFDENGLTHTQRIINYHRGYLDNFMDCCDKLLYPKIKNNRELEEKYLKLINKIVEIRSNYRHYRSISW